MRADRQVRFGSQADIYPRKRTYSGQHFFWTSLYPPYPFHPLRRPGAKLRLKFVEGALECHSFGVGRLGRVRFGGDIAPVEFLTNVGNFRGLHPGAYRRGER